RLRERLLQQARELGLAPEVEYGFACRRARICSAVENVVASLPGAGGTGDTLLLASHYDSVGAGPGVSDDLSGVAAMLEIGRILKAEPRHRNTVVLLFDEGEEDGLLGAQAFLE